VQVKIARWISRLDATGLILNNGTFRVEVPKRFDFARPIRLDAVHHHPRRVSQIQDRSPVYGCPLQSETPSRPVRKIEGVPNQHLLRREGVVGLFRTRCLSAPVDHHDVVPARVLRILLTETLGHVSSIRESSPIYQKITPPGVDRQMQFVVVLMSPTPRTDIEKTPVRVR
jgi:hypothetical protein